MVAKTPTEALAPVASSTDKTNLISAADAMIAAVDAIVAGNTQTYTVVIGGTPTGGTFTITVTDAKNGAQVTSGLAYNATASAIQTALRAMTGAGMSTTTVTQTGTTPNFTNTIQFKATDITKVVTATSSLTGGTPTITVTQTAAYSRKINPQGADMFEEHFVDLLETLAINMRAT